MTSRGDVRQRFSVSVWSPRRAAYVPLGGTHTAQDVAGFRERGWKVASNPIEHFEDARTRQLRELDELARGVERIPSVMVRAAAHRSLAAMRAKLGAA